MSAQVMSRAEGTIGGEEQSLNRDALEEFDRIFGARLVIVGIGNFLRSDDALGPELVRRIAGKIGAVCIDAGSAPENYLGRIVKEKPDTLLLVDAVDMGLSPGDYRILEPSEIVDSGVSTHDVSLKLLVDFIMGEIDCGVYIIGVQPETVRFGETVSEPVAHTLYELEEALLKLVGREVSQVGRSAGCRHRGVGRT
jgi:hydrogenase 3 maturation protease